MTALLAATVIVLAPLISGAAEPSCYPEPFAGSVNDISLIEVDRCQATNVAYPCFHAMLRPNSGYLVAYRLNDLRGGFEADLPNGAWNHLVALLVTARFPDIEPLQLGTVLDAPEDQVIVQRCYTYTAIRIGGVAEESQAYRSWMALVTDLTSVISGLQWRDDGTGTVVTSGKIYQYLLP